MLEQIKTECPKTFNLFTRWYYGDFADKTYLGVKVIEDCDPDFQIQMLGDWLSTIGYKTNNSKDIYFIFKTLE